MLMGVVLGKYNCFFPIKMQIQVDSLLLAADLRRSPDRNFLKLE